MAALSCFILIASFTDAHINLNKRIYSEPIYATVAALLGIYAVVAISYCIAQVKYLGALFTKLGRGSLYILIFHTVIHNRFFEYFSVKLDNKLALLFLVVCAFIISLFLPLLLKLIIERSAVLSLAFEPVARNPIVKRFSKTS